VLGKRVFRNCAPFLKVHDSGQEELANARMTSLDDSRIHPESYRLALQVRGMRVREGVCLGKLLCAAGAQAHLVVVWLEYSMCTGVMVRWCDTAGTGQVVPIPYIVRRESAAQVISRASRLMYHILLPSPCRWPTPPWTSTAAPGSVMTTAPPRPSDGWSLRSWRTRATRWGRMLWCWG
jgi:hypothetical protein